MSVPWNGKQYYITVLRHLNGSALKIASSKRKMLCAGKGISGLFYDIVEKLHSTVINQVHQNPEETVVICSDT